VIDCPSFAGDIRPTAKESGIHDRGSPPMSTKAHPRRAWCTTCRAFTDHRTAAGEGNPPSGPRLECITCHGGGQAV